MTDWIEPTPPVRWGNPRWRYGVGLVTIVLGVAATTLTSTYSLGFLLTGPLVQLIGWLILPGALWRRLLVLLPCLLAALVLLAGPDFVGAFAVLLAGWLFARHRPALSYLALLPVIVLSFVLKGALNEYGQNWIALLSCSVMVVVCAWLGRALAVWRWRARTAARDRAAARAGSAAPAYGPPAGAVSDPVSDAVSAAGEHPRQPE